MNTTSNICMNAGYNMCMSAASIICMKTPFNEKVVELVPPMSHMCTMTSYRPGTRGVPLGDPWGPILGNSTALS